MALRARRWLRVLLFLGLFAAGLVLVGLVTIQTAWFKDWLRGYVSREARSFLNGELVIGRLGGNLLTGLELQNVSIRQGGEAIVTIKDVGLDYSLLEIVSRGLVIDDIRINQPHIVLRRTAEGWNLSRLVKREASEADREGPGRPVRVGSIGISDGSLVIDDLTLAPGAATPLPRRVSRIDFKGSFDYQPVDFTLTVAHLSLRADDPSLALNSLSGTIAARGDDLHMDRMAVRTAESSLQLGGVLRNYLGTPVVEARLTSDRTTLRELGGFVPALAPLSLQPAYEINVNGPLEALRVDLDVRDAAGAIKGQLVVDAKSIVPAVRGSLESRHVRLEQIEPGLPVSDLTARATFDLHGHDAATLAGSMRVETPAVAVAGYRADALKAAVRVEDGHARLDAAVRAYGAALTARGVVEVPRTAASDVALNLDGRIDRLDLARLPRTGGVPTLRTHLQGTYRLARAHGATDAGVVFDASTIEGSHIAAGTRAEGRLEGERFTATASGRVDLIDVTRLARALDQPALTKGPLAGADVRALTFDINAAGRLNGEMSGHARVDVPEAHLLGGTVRAASVDATVNGAALTASAAGQFDRLDPARAADRPEVAGAVSGSVDARVELPDWRHPELGTSAGSARLDVAASRLGTLDVEHATLRADLRDGAVEIQQLDVASSAANVVASGRAALTGSASSLLTYKVDVADLAAAARLAGVADVSGSAAMEGRVTGRADDLRTTGTLSTTSVRYGSAVDVLSSKSRYDVSVANLSPASVRASLKTEATLVKAAGQELQDVTLDVAYADRAADFATTVRQAKLKLETSGHVRLRDAGVEAKLATLTLTAIAPDSRWALTAPAELVYDASKVTVSPLALQNGDQRVSISGTAAIGSAGVARAVVSSDAPLVVEAVNIDLADVDRLAGTARKARGRLSLKATVSGSLDRPHARADLSITDGGVDKFTFETFHATLDHGDTQTRVDVRLDQAPGTWLTAAATLPTIEGFRSGGLDEAPVDARIASSPIDLGLVQGFTDAVSKVTGTLEANIHVAGTVGAPKVDGRLRVSQGAFTATAAGTSFKGLDAAVVLEGGRVTVESFRILDPNDHPLTVTGFVVLPGAAPASAELALRAQDFSVMQGALGKLALDADVRLTGVLAKEMRVAGEVSVKSGRLEVDRLLEHFGDSAYATEAATPATSESLNPLKPDGSPKAASQQASTDRSASASRSAAGPPTGAASGSLLDSLSADLRVRVPNNLVLRGDNLKVGSAGFGLGDVNITVGGDVHATKALGGRPLVVGSVRTVRGFYEFQGRRFELQRDGSISFKGPDPTDPALDITALRQISGVDAIVRVMGTAQRPELELSSRPPLDQADVLSLIIFNRPINDLGEGEKTTLAQRAGSIVEGALAAPIAEALRNALNVDQLEITPVSDQGNSPSVTVGNQVGEKVYIRVRQQFGASSTSALLLEYELNRLLRLQTSISDSDDTARSSSHNTERGAFDLIFVVRY